MPNVALFITCLTDQFYPHVGVAVTKILEHYGCRVSFPQAQTCCGQPFFNNGFHDHARELAKKMIEDFEGYEYIVTTICNDAGCSMNISGMCHRRGVDTKVKHFAELMAEAMGIGIAEW